MYLLSNDEPVWTDLEDTIHVIDWTLDSLKSIGYHCSNKLDIINTVSRSFSDIISNKNHFNYKDISYNKNISDEFDFYNISNDSLKIFTFDYSINLIDNYYDALTKIFPGDLHMQKLLNN